MAASSSGVLVRLSSCVLRLPTPCSAAMEPPSARTRSCTSLREGDAGGTDVEVQVPVAVVAEDGGLYAREGLLKGGACFPDEADEA